MASSLLNSVTAALRCNEQHLTAWCSPVKLLNVDAVSWGSRCTAMQTRTNEYLSNTHLAVSSAFRFRLWKCCDSVYNKQVITSSFCVITIWRSVGKHSDVRTPGDHVTDIYASYFLFYPSPEWRKEWKTKNVFHYDIKNVCLHITFQIMKITRTDVLYLRH